MYISLSRMDGMYCVAMLAALPFVVDMIISVIRRCSLLFVTSTVHKQNSMMSSTTEIVSRPAISERRYFYSSMHSPGSLSFTGA